jgi:hypothetical protein
MGIRVKEVRVPAIVFDYPRHSGATDEGMTYGSSILAYLVFSPGRTSTERIARPISIRLAQPRSKTWRTRQGSKRPSRIRT